MKKQLKLPLKYTSTFTRPDILTHPNIPKPLHGTNPRTIMGQDWWDEQRQIAYKVNNYHCWACSISKYMARYHYWLEAHEYYSIDYVNGKATLVEIVALCHSCHNFIHSGRLQAMLGKGECTREKVLDILEHGFKICRRHDLTPFWGTRLFYLTEFKGMNTRGALKALKMSHELPATTEDHVRWDQWRLVFNDKEYKGQFKTFEDWEEFYA